MTLRTVAICGSCATRDNFNSRFNPDHRHWYETVAASHQSAVLSLMSPPIEPEIDEHDGLDEHEETTLRADLSRSFLTALAEARPDYLVLDFSGDAWFGVLRLPDGRFITDNPWKLRKTAFYRRLAAEGSLTPLSGRTDPEAYFALWTASMDRFAAHIAEHCPGTRVFVHRIRSVAEVTLDHHDRPRNLRRWARLQPIDLKQVNAFRARLDEHAITAYGWQPIDLRAERYAADGHHPWGAYWVHYTGDYHRRFLAELHRHDLLARLDPELGDRVRAIADAGSERLVSQARFVRRADRSQRRRIQVLERRGILATGRAVLSRGRSGRMTAR